MAEPFPFEVGWVIGMTEEDEQQSESNLHNQFHESTAANSSMATSAAPPAQKKKRAQPDPEAEVIALSPETLMATNRFTCEVCNKRFNREQNLQLHRRRHSLPWSLKGPKGARKKVYVCPEPTCPHHNPSRALGDLNSAKKHFFRKHCEKNLKCAKCHKMYAVLSDLNAHYKTCGAKEYLCECGIFFSRHDSFVMHRGFCHAVHSMNLSAITSQLFGSNNVSTSPHQHMLSFEDQTAYGFQYLNGHVLPQLSGSSTIIHQKYHEDHRYASSNKLVINGMIQQLPQDQSFFYNTAASTHFSPSNFHANQFSQSPSLQNSNAFASTQLSGSSCRIIPSSPFLRSLGSTMYSSIHDLQASSFSAFLRDDGQNSKKKTICIGDYATYGEPELSFLQLLEDEECSNEQQQIVAGESFDDGCDRSTRDLLGVGLGARQVSQGSSQTNAIVPASTRRSSDELEDIDSQGEDWDFRNG